MSVVKPVTILLERYKRNGVNEYFLELHQVDETIEVAVAEMLRSPEVITSASYASQQIGDIFMVEGTKAELFLVLTDIITYMHEHAIEYTYDFNKKETA